MLSRYDPINRLALVACLVHAARMRARDDLAEMLCKRVAANVKRARAEPEEIRVRQRAVCGAYQGGRGDLGNPVDQAEQAEQQRHRSRRARSDS